ncbi:hypothetical protein GCM10008013_04630 [Paenibacillus segetis]|uniref:Uncharacterized protein n=1 Tax=Paenibacillus segetis TaxID=1325360 RepID=A0ABQ1Y4F8_9BACL|nr:hypothetical protein GCM10008013_04630 [Paenibacillus segetis]
MKLVFSMFRNYQDENSYAGLLYISLYRNIVIYKYFDEELAPLG